MAERDENFDPDPETTCTICSAEFLDPEDLELHMSQLHPEQSSLVACHFCPSTFSSSEKYAYHLRDEHITSLKSCRHCKKVFTGFVALRKHEIKHKTDGSKKLLSCSQCKAVFENSFNLEQHELQDHNNNLDGVMLHEIFPILSSVLNIKADIFLQSMGTNTVYICVCCKMTTDDVHKFIKHTKEKDCRSLVCDKCSNVYKNLHSMKRHLLMHKECYNYVKEEDKKKPCPKCGLDVEKLHMTSHVLTCNPLICRICNLHFITVDALTLHQSTEHPLAISLKNCQFCRREFVGTVALEKHIKRAHKAEFHLYKYMCVYCEKMYFKHPKNLFFHFFSKHHDLEPYWCKICDKKFRLRKKFTIHIKLDHKSQGFVEFDENYHVFFADKKSEKPFQPTSLLVSEEDKRDPGSQTETEIQQTDKETDAETSNKPRTSKKPLKLLLKEHKKGSKKADLSLNSDFMSVTETEGNVTETDTKNKKARMKRKRKSKLEIPEKTTIVENGEEFTEVEMLEDSDLSDDEPLDKVKKKLKNSKNNHIPAWNKKKIVKTEKTTLSRKKFTCKICKKYCYTFQNYHHHISLHFKDGSKKCIKCSKEFKSKAELDRHVAKKHTTSKLTETLKTLLERRKRGGSNVQLTPREKFFKTIKKVRSNPVEVAAKITEASKDLSVQKFIESFTPDEQSKKESVEFDTIVTMKPLKNAVRRPPAIKMTKFIPKPPTSSLHVRLSMPVRFKQPNGEPVKATIKLISPVITDVTSYANQEQDYDDSYNYQDYEEEIGIDVGDKNDTVPEVAQEVMLEGTEEPRNVQQLQHNIVLPKLPQGYQQIRIAHLQPQAPYYKIVKVGDVIKEERKDAKPEEPSNETIEDLKLPGGAKLVNVNPLAHLLGDTPIEQVIGEPNKKYYKPKNSNFVRAIAKALLQLDKPSPKPKPRVKKPPSTKKTKKSVEVEQ